MGKSWITYSVVQPSSNTNCHEFTGSKNGAAVDNMMFVLAHEVSSIFVFYLNRGLITFIVDRLSKQLLLQTPHLLTGL
jgi:hypothetical protein